MPFTPSPRFRACADRAIHRALGKPWRVMGRGPDAFDCVGFVQHVLAAGGVTTPLFEYPAGVARDEAFRAGVPRVEAAGWVQVPARTPYAVVLLGRRGVVTHVGLYHPVGLVYHSFERCGVVGHTLQFLSTIFDTFQYWSPPDGVGNSQIELPKPG